MSKPIINIKHYYDEKSISKTMTIDINHKINELNIMTLLQCPIWVNKH